MNDNTLRNINFGIVETALVFAIVCCILFLKYEIDRHVSLVAAFVPASVTVISCTPVARSVCVVTVSYMYRGKSYTSSITSKRRYATGHRVHLLIDPNTPNNAIFTEHEVPPNVITTTKITILSFVLVLLLVAVAFSIFAWVQESRG